MRNQPQSHSRATLRSFSTHTAPTELLRVLEQRPPGDHLDVDEVVRIRSGAELVIEDSEGVFGAHLERHVGEREVEFPGREFRANPFGGATIEFSGESARGHLDVGDAGDRELGVGAYADKVGGYLLHMASVLYSV